MDISLSGMATPGNLETPCWTREITIDQKEKSAVSYNHISVCDKVLVFALSV
jgi:hypothetical protein